jgi:hypothetical protein
VEEAGKEESCKRDRKSPAARGGATLTLSHKRWVTNKIQTTFSDPNATQLEISNTHTHTHTHTNSQSIVGEESSTIPISKS